MAKIGNEKEIRNALVCVVCEECVCVCALCRMFRLWTLPRRSSCDVVVVVAVRLSGSRKLAISLSRQ